MQPSPESASAVHAPKPDSNLTPQEETVPGQPDVLLQDPAKVREFLERELYSPELESLAPRLWIMTTPSSKNVNPLHRQRVKGREILITEEPRLHLLWNHDRIFIKPIPRCLLSSEFWERYLSDAPNQSDQWRRLRHAGMGFLRSYRYLIRHESDFRIAQQDHLALVPKELDWPAYCRFISPFAHIDDCDVSGRYCYGELRLTRLNIYAPLLLRKFHYEQLYGQYSDFFGRLFPPLLFIFAVLSIILNSMQVELMVDQIASEHWVALWPVCRYFSALSLIGAVTVSVWLIVLWWWVFLDEWIYTIRQRRARKQPKGQTSGQSRC